MILAIVSAIMRIALVTQAVFLLTHPSLADVFNRRERWGIGFMGGCGFLTVPVILDVHKTGTPFDIIAGLMFTLGAVLFFSGFTDRKLGHARRNAQQKQGAKEYFARKGQ